MVETLRVGMVGLGLVATSHLKGYLSHPRSAVVAICDLDQARALRFAEENGIEALVGPAGSVCLCHSIVVHGSANNVSPWRRAIMYLIYNAVSNACTNGDRPWFQNNRDFTPLETIDDGALRELST